jgi:hypothetical protein
VGGSVIGVVTSAGGSADIVAANTSEDIDITTGDADAANVGDSFVGQDAFVLEFDFVFDLDVADVAAGEALNAQDGDNDLSADQSAVSSSGDGVGGQVLGIVSAGDTSIDSTNSSSDVDLTTGDAASAHAFDSFVGQDAFLVTGFGGFIGGDVEAQDLSVGDALNAQEGDNSKDLSQDAVASSGDAVGGTVAGVVTSAGGSADLVLANTSEDIDVDSGDSDFFNDDDEFVGQQVELIDVGLLF